MSGIKDFLQAILYCQAGLLLLLSTAPGAAAQVSARTKMLQFKYASTLTRRQVEGSERTGRQPSQIRNQAALENAGRLLLDGSRKGGAAAEDYQDKGSAGRTAKAA